MPEVVGADRFKGDFYHISDMKSADVLKDKRIAVVGFGKSATDAALAAHKHGRASHIIVRRLHWPVPRNLAGILPFKWGLLNRLTVTVIPQYKTPSALEKRVHTIGKPLVWLFWRVVELLLTVQCGLWSKFGTRPSLVPDESADVGAFSEATMVPRPGFFEAVRKGDITLHRGGIREMTENGVVLDDGEHIELDAVLFATGWRSDYSFLSAELQSQLGFGDDGIYLYRQMVHPNTPGVAFIGYASTVSNVLAYAMQAHWLAGLIRGRHQLPPVSDQLRKSIC